MIFFGAHELHFFPIVYRKCADEPNNINALNFFCSKLLAKFIGNVFTREKKYANVADLGFF